MPYNHLKVNHKYCSLEELTPDSSPAVASMYLQVCRRYVVNKKKLNQRRIEKARLWSVHFQIEENTISVIDLLLTSIS